MDKVQRRTFMKSTAGTAGAVMAAQLIGTSNAWSKANDKLRVAVIGLNGRGKSHINGHQGADNVEVVTLCDPDENVLAERAASFEERYKKKVHTEVDMRKVFDDPNIDAVSIATPNHWHSLAAIWACQAEKDVYVEKPGSHNIFEGRKMVEAAHKYKRIVQHGVQLRSSPALQEAVQHLRDGLIGDVYLARGLCFRWRGSIGKKPDGPVPKHLRYKLWLGPAEDRPFNPNLVHYNWHWHWDFGNGDVGNQGVHETDMCMWGLGVDTLPDAVTAMGGKFLWDDDKETPELLTTLFKYNDLNKMIQFETRPWCSNREGGYPGQKEEKNDEGEILKKAMESREGAGVGNIFYGKDGYMVIKGYNRYETYLGKEREPGPARDEGGNHFANFHQAVRSRKTSDQNGPVETAHLASGIAHMGNTAYRLGRVLNFDPKSETYVGDEEANAMLTRNYRAPFVVPDKV